MLHAGFAESDISPGRENSLLGYEFRQEQLPAGNSGVHDPLKARVLVLHDGAALAAVVCLDLCILLPALARQLRAAVAKKVGTSAERVLVACSHTHSGPFAIGPEDEKELRATFPSASRGGANAAYAEYLEGRILDAAARAANLLFPVRIESQQAPCAIAYTRRHSRADGTVSMVWNPQESRTLDGGGVAPSVLGAESALAPTADPSATLICLRQTNGPRVIQLWSIGAHPTVMGKTATHVSADWPGLACTQLETQDPSGNTHAMFFLGACGDTHAWIATQESYRNLAVVSTAAASFVSLLGHATQASAGDGLAIAAKTVTVGATELDIAAWALGSTLIVAAPVELFAPLGADLRRRLAGRFAHVIVSTNTQGWTGYWPTSAAFAEGEYEAGAARGMARLPGDSERLVEELVALARSLPR